MLFLLLLYLASHSWAKGLRDSFKNYFVDDVPRDSNYTLQHITHCPKSGYFLELDDHGCHLCFCQERGPAVCWLRENRICQQKAYAHNVSLATKGNRKRRSPFGLADIFFQDAAREVLNKKEPENCKPYESSFSEGCPPVDWCIGCTVCDCNANGHWDCHILSFCDDAKGKKNKNKKSAPSFPQTFKSKKAKKLPTKLNKNKNTTIKPPLIKAKRGPSIATKPRSVIQKKKPVKPLIIKKNENNRKVVKSSTSKKVLNGSEAEMSEVIMKTMMTVMAKMWNKQVTEALPKVVSMVQKRSFPQLFNKTNGNYPPQFRRTKPKPKPKGREHVYNKSLFIKKQEMQERKKAKELLKKKQLEEKKRKENQAAIRKQNKAAGKKPPNNNKMRTKRELDSNSSANYVSESIENQFNSDFNPVVFVTTEQPVINDNTTLDNSTTRTINTTYFEEDNFTIVENNTSTTDKLSLPNNNLFTNDVVTETVLDTVMETNMPMTKFAEVTTTDITNVPNNLSTTDNNLLTSNSYYEYTVNFTTETPLYKTNFSEVKVISNAESSTIKNHVQTVKNMTEKIKHKINYEIPNEVVNDIKHTKWSVIKMFQNKERNADRNLNKTDDDDTFNVIGSPPTARLVDEERRRIINKKDVGRKVDRTTKKYSLTRMINTINCKNKKGSNLVSEDNYRVSLTSKIDSLRNVLKRLLSEFHKNNTISHATKRKKANAVKYLKKLFNKIFYQDSNKTIISQRLRNNNHTIETLCESFGPCVINKRNKEVLMKKINELNNATIQILKSLRIIKGLLRLVDIPRGHSTISTNATFKSDIHKLNIILRQSLNDDSIRKLPESQRIQVKYIKSNTKEFTLYVAKFTKILNQIIDLISIKGEKQKAHRWYNEAKSTNSVKNPKQATVKTFKQLLHNYNIIHNTFIKKIIETFGNLQNTQVKRNIVDKRNAKNSELMLKNLNKLKNLESVLNRGKRQKRHVVRQDNAVEYLLMLMEYMFQNNYHLDNAPVNDGIDLLIEAIKSAPDIKTIKKKVLRNKVFKASDLKEIEASFNQSISKEESSVDILNKDRVSNQVDNSSTYQNSEDEDESDNIELLKLRTGTGDTETNNTDKDNNTINTSEDVESNNKTAEASTVYTQITSKRSESYQKEEIFDEPTDKPSQVYVGQDDILADFDRRLEKASGEIGRKNVDASDLEDDTDETLSYNNVTHITGEITNVTKTKQNTPEADGSNKVEEDDLSQITLKSMKSVNESNEFSPEWSNEKDSNDQEVISSNKIDESTPISTATTIKTPSKEESKALKDSDLSDLSREYSDEKAKVKVKKAEEVLIKKEQSLLNSLDYDTEPTTVEDSKDDNDDKFLNDYFADE